MSAVISSNKTLFYFPSSVSIFIFWWWQGPWEQSEKQQEPINSFILTLGSWEGELVLRLLPLKWFLFISALSSEWFGHDPDSDQEHLPEDRSRTELRELRSREISLIPHGGISREGEYWDYLIIICKIRTQRQDNPLASGWYFSVEWMVLILHCVNFEGLHQTDQTLARKMTEQVGISFYWLETFLQIYYQLLKSSGKLIAEKIKV